MKKLARIIVSLVLATGPLTQAWAAGCPLYAPTTVTSGGVTYAAPVVAGTGLLTAGNNSTITGTAGAIAANGTGTVMTTTLVPPALTAVAPPGMTLPAFSPTTFPAVGGTDNTLKNMTLAAGSYGIVTVDKAATFSGGSYPASGTYISEFKTKGDGDTLTMAAGDYFVDKWSTGNNFTLVTSGTVRIYIKTSFQSGNGAAFNVAGNVQDLQIYAYSGATLQFGDTSNNPGSAVDYNGIIYAPFSTTKIQFGNNNTLQGSVLSGGTVQLGNNTAVLFSATTQAAVASVVVAPTGGICYYALSGSSAGLTSSANPLAVSACLDTAAPCTSFYTGGATGTLGAAGTGMTVNWSGGAGFTIAAGSSSVTKNVQVATAGKVTFGVSSTTPPSISTVTVCNFGDNANNDNCVFTASVASLFVSDSATGSSYTIPSQVAGAATPQLYLRAGNASGTFMSAITSSTATVNMGYTCNNPTTCQAGNLTTINATTIPGSPNSTPKLNSATVSLTFDANGSAPVTARYDDAGQITLNASTIIPAPFTGGTAVTLTGGSNAYVVKPHHFELSSIQQTVSPNLANPMAADATGAKFVKAGEAFSVTVKAKNALVDPLYNTTKNYGQETTPESVKLTPVLATGLGLTNNPAIGGTFGAFSNGVATGTAFTWNEAGIMKLTPSVGDSDYLGAGDVTGTQSGNVGRFYAAKFAITGGVIAKRADNLCSIPVAGCGAFSYMGEQMSAVFSLTAQAVDGTTLQNYNYSATAANNFAKLTPTAAANPLGLALAYATASTAVAAVDATTIAVGSTAGFAVGDALWIPGAGASGAALSATVASKTGNSITFNTPIVTAVPAGTKVERDLSARLDTSVAASGNFVAGVANITAPLMLTRGATSNYYQNLDIGIAPTDSDGAKMASYDLDADSTVAGNDHARVGGAEARYGQIKLTSAYGSELLPLRVNATAQYWDGTKFITNEQDGYSTLAPANLTLSNYQKNLVAGNTGYVTPPASATFNKGIASFFLSAPGANKNGSVEMSVTSLSGAGCNAVPNLLGCYLPSSAAGRAIFGVYKGNDAFIYMRENY